MPHDDEVESLEEAVSAELHRLVAATEPVLRSAVTGGGGHMTHEEEWGAVTHVLTGFANVIIGLARAVDALDRRSRPTE